MPLTTIFQVDSALRALSTLRGLRGTPEVPLCRETQSLGQQMLERWEQMGYACIAACETTVHTSGSHVYANHAAINTVYCIIYHKVYYDIINISCLLNRYAAHVYIYLFISCIHISYIYIYMFLFY